MTKRQKPEMVPLRRENRGILTDPQFSGYLPGERYIVFLDYGHPDGHLGTEGFRTKSAAEAWIKGQKAKAAEARPA